MQLIATIRFWFSQQASRHPRAFTETSLRNFQNEPSVILSTLFLLVLPHGSGPCMPESHRDNRVSYSYQFVLPRRATP